MVQTNEYLIGQQPPLPPSPTIINPGWHHLAVVHAFHNTMAASPTTLVPPKPTVLLLGEIVIAHAEWDALAAIAELRVSTRPT